MQWISYGSETGGVDREQHFVTHDRRAYLGSGDVSNRLQSPNMWKEKQTFTFVPSLVKLQRILFQLTSVPRFTVSAGFLQPPNSNSIGGDGERWSQNSFHYISLPSFPLSLLFEGGRCFKGGQQGKYLAALRGCCYFYSGSDVGILWFYLKPKKL